MVGPLTINSQLTNQEFNKYRNNQFLLKKFNAFVFEKLPADIIYELKLFFVVLIKVMSERTNQVVGSVELF